MGDGDGCEPHRTFVWLEISSLGGCLWRWGGTPSLCATSCARTWVCLCACHRRPSHTASPVRCVRKLTASPLSWVRKLAALPLSWVRKLTTSPLSWVRKLTTSNATLRAVGRAAFRPAGIGSGSERWEITFLPTKALGTRPAGRNRRNQSGMRVKEDRRRT
jgi:hypothetical protein